MLMVFIEILQPTSWNYNVVSYIPYVTVPFLHLLIFEKQKPMC